MGKVVLDISMSLDGFIAGPNDNPEQPLGDGGMRLHDWMSSTSEDTMQGGTSGSFDSRVAISPRRSCASGSAAVCKLRFLPEHGVFGEHVLVLPPDGHPTQKASDPDSILEPPLLATR